MSDLLVAGNTVIDASLESQWSDGGGIAVLELD